MTDFPRKSSKWQDKVGKDNYQGRQYTERMGCSDQRANNNSWPVPFARCNV
uniref:Uncharacterized protein n=1 Tax=Rhizophora mucronata TaxID=61149 RepID=A0A2P2NFW9_RHIMU